MWVTDGVWSDFLTHLHYGQVQKSHLDMLHKQIIRAPGCPETNFDTEHGMMPHLSPQDTQFECNGTTCQSISIVETRK